MDIIMIISINWRCGVVRDSDFLKTIGQRIMTRRRFLKMTQEELAEQIGTSTQMISNLELGKKAIRPENLARVCKVLELSADFVLTGVEGMTPMDQVADKLISLTPQELQMVSDMIDYMNSKK